MGTLLIHADRTVPAIVKSEDLPWIPSPELGVERRMLERAGGEVAVASSIVRYRAGSRFPSHAHPLGEEFLVLDGTFSDEHGDYPIGTYVRNPPGSAHAPFSKDGCVIFVKLRQMDVDEYETVRVLPAKRSWHPGKIAGHEVATLYDNGRVKVTIERLHIGATLPANRVGGEELLVLEGAVDVLDEQSQSLGVGTWCRWPGGKQSALITHTGALLWMKRGHLK